MARKIAQFPPEKRLRFSPGWGAGEVRTTIGAVGDAVVALKQLIGIEVVNSL